MCLRMRSSYDQEKNVKNLVNFLVPGLILAVAHMASAQDASPIVADRPGFSSSPVTVQSSRLQLESGYQFTHDGGSFDFDDHTLPLLLLRYGLNEQVELQFAWAGHSWTETSNRNTNGFSDASVGVKWRVNDGAATVPVALFASLSLPVGADEYSSDDVDPTIGAFWSYSAKFDWFGTVLVNESDGDVTIGNALGISLPVNDATGAYIEYFGSYAGPGGPSHVLNGGLAYLPRNDLQLDINAGIGLNDRAADLFIGLGIAHRF